MCQNIVGTEEHVRIIRMMNAVNDHIASSEAMTIITSGSFGEGLKMRGSDIDGMAVEKGIEVCEDIKVRFDPNISYFSIETDDVKPGFTQLRQDHNISEQCVFEQ